MIFLPVKIEDQKCCVLKSRTYPQARHHSSLSHRSAEPGLGGNSLNIMAKSWGLLSRG